MPAIIVYFSRPGNNYVNGEIRNLPVGNTEVAAQMLQELTGAELFRIETLVRYSEDYSECTEQALRDQKRDARSELVRYPAGMEAFDTVYLAFPNYWNTMPMGVFTFLEKYDFTGKTILPLCTHEGSGMGQSESDILRLCPGAILKRGLAIHGAEVQSARPLIKKWIEQ